MCPAQRFSGIELRMRPSRLRIMRAFFSTDLKGEKRMNAICSRIHRSLRASAAAISAHDRNCFLPIGGRRPGSLWHPLLLLPLPLPASPLFLYPSSPSRGKELHAAITMRQCKLDDGVQRFWHAVVRVHPTLSGHLLQMK